MGKAQVHGPKHSMMSPKQMEANHCETNKSGLSKGKGPKVVGK